MMMVIMDKMRVDTVKLAHIFAANRLFRIIARQQRLIDGKEPSNIINDDPDIVRNKYDRHVLLPVQLAKKFIETLLRHHIDTGVGLVKDQNLRF